MEKDGIDTLTSMRDSLTLLCGGRNNNPKWNVQGEELCRGRAAPWGICYTPAMILMLI